ncbi:MAG: class I SAM-dependent methyltransferase, partial [Loktanella sp.]|nr:class I SAM-dependent methyltransferase [Loktanella sp.]
MSTDFATRPARRVSVPIDFLLISAEELPLPDSSVDTAVTTWSLCTIPDPVKALREVRRVLR